MGIGKKIALGIAGGLQGGVQGIQTGMQLENMRKQAENQAMFAQAQADEAAIRKQEMAQKQEATARGHLFGIMATIAKAPPEDRKNVAKQFFPKIQQLAPTAGWTPFNNEDDLVSHVSIKELGDSYQNVYEARLAIPKILSGQVTPEQAALTFDKARNGLDTQVRYTTDKNELEVLAKDRASLLDAEKQYNEKFAKKLEAQAPAAVLGGQPISKENFDVIQKAGGVEATGALSKSGDQTLPVLGKKPKEGATKEERLASQFLTNQTNKLSTDLNKNKVPQLEKSLLEIDNQLAALPKDRDGKFNIPGYGAGTNALPQWLLSKDGKKMRQYIQNATDQLLRQRSGAQINETELKRLNDIAGTGKFQTEQTVLDGLQLIKDSVTAVKETISGGYSPDVIQNYLNNQKNAPAAFNPLSNEGKKVDISGFNLDNIP